jgi:hypothetical protein
MAENGLLSEREIDALDQCYQLLAKLFGQINQKLRPLAKKFVPS